jgi:hypothetical protein
VVAGIREIQAEEQRGRQQDLAIERERIERRRGIDRACGCVPTRAAAEREAGSRAGSRESSGRQHDGMKAAEWRIHQPQADGGEQNSGPALHAAVVARGFRASHRRRIQRQQCIAAGIETGPADPAERVRGQRRERRRDEKQEQARREYGAAEREHAGFGARVRDVADNRSKRHARHRERCEREADGQRRAAELSDVKRKRRRQKSVVGVAQQLRQAEQRESLAPNRVGLGGRHGGA